MANGISADIRHVCISAPAMKVAKKMILSDPLANQIFWKKLLKRGGLSFKYGIFI
jgi:hypothetical protein